MAKIKVGSVLKLNGKKVQVVSLNDDGTATLNYTAGQGHTGFYGKVKLNTGKAPDMWNPQIFDASLGEEEVRAKTVTEMQGLEEAHTCVNDAEANGTAVQLFSRSFVNLTPENTTTAVTTAEMTKNPEALHQMSQLYAAAAVPAGQTQGVYPHAQVGIALAVNPNLSESDRMLVAEKLNLDSLVHAARATDDAKVLTTIYAAGAVKSTHGDLEQAIMSNSNVEAGLAETILSKAPGFAAEYYNAVGYNDLVDKYAKEFYNNPQLDRHPEIRTGLMSNSRIYPDYGTGSAVNRKNSVDRILMREAGLETVERVLSQKGLYEKRDVPADLLYNKNVPLSYMKENADKINYASSVALNILREERGTKDVPAKLVAALEASSAGHWVTEIREADKVNGANPKASDIKDPWLQPYIGKYYSQEKVYKALEKKLASEIDTESNVYRKARAVKLLADQYKDKLKVRAAFANLD
jgi:hypothetical protein